jgi:hypothetical protein
MAKLLKSLNDVLLAAAFVGFLFVPSAFPVNPIPTVVAPVVPQAVSPGSGAFMLEVYGANFVPGTVVNWNGSPRSTNFVSRREIKAKILASDVAQPTTGHITVTNPGPGGGNSNSSYAVVEVHTPDPTVVPAPPYTYQLKFDGIYTLVTGDFYSHNKLDLLAGGGSGNVYLLEGDGDGTFGRSLVVGREYFVTYCDWPTSIAVGDFNNDGKLDFVFSAGVQTAGIQVRLNSGNGSFQTSWRYGKYDGCPNLAVGDFDGDGNLDFASVLGNAMDIFLGNGDGTFRKGHSYSFPDVHLSPLVADFNGDGVLDLVVDGDAGLQILLGNGDGTFQKPRTVIKPPAGKAFDCGYGQSLVVSDFDNDGKTDLAACYDPTLSVPRDSSSARKWRRDFQEACLLPRWLPCGQQRRYLGVYRWRLQFGRQDRFHRLVLQGLASRIYIRHSKGQWGRHVSATNDCEASWQRGRYRNSAG